MGRVVASHLSNKMHIPFIYTEHSSTILKQSLNSIERRTYSKILNNSQGIIAVSSACAGNAIYAHHSINVIPNFIDESLFNIMNNEKFAGFNYLYIGDLITNKQVNKIIEAFSILTLKFTNLNLHIVGDGPMKKNLLQQSIKLNLSKRIKFYGNIPNESLPGIINRCQILLSTSKFETFGIVVLEALFCGKPVVCTPSGGPSDLINALNGLILDNDDIRSIVSGMEVILKQYFL
ncbi:MAG: glycosyltransferase [Saprospiraceae bacterium]